MGTGALGRRGVHVPSAVEEEHKIEVEPVQTQPLNMVVLRVLVLVLPHKLAIHRAV